MTKEERKRQLKRRYLKAIISASLFGAVIGGSLGYAKHDNEHFSLDEVQLEIDIHSGVGLTPDGRHIDPYLEHGCEVPNDGRTFEERLSDRMFEEGYDQKTISAAIDKFNLQYEKEFDLAKEINLKQIEKEAKDAKLMARGR